MICPCKSCKRQGCGTAHDTCKPYQEWLRYRARGNAVRQLCEDVTNAVVNAHWRKRGKKKR